MYKEGMRWTQKYQHSGNRVKTQNQQTVPKSEDTKSTNSTKDNAKKQTKSNKQNNHINILDKYI